MARNLASVIVSTDERKKAIAEHNPVAYFNACNQYGFRPDEDPELYEQGRQLAEVPRKEDYELPKSPIPKVRRDSRQFIRLLSAHENRGIDEKRPLDHPTIKERLFQQFFPGHYREIENLTFNQMGVHYRAVIQHARKVREHHKRR